jgi:hypothetical protein
MWMQARRHGLPGPLMNESAFSREGLAIVALTGVLVVSCVMLHYEAFTLLHKALGRLQLHVRRRRILLLMFSLLALHVGEIWLFGLGYDLILSNNGVSAIRGAQGSGLLESVYFSAVLYSTLGLGDLTPVGPLRFMAGTESLTGFLLITWSASFTFLEMQRFWKSS